MSKTICGWCGKSKDGHTIPGWNYCQSKTSQRNSSKEMPGGVG